jgi:hypothetical protein
MKFKRIILGLFAIFFLITLMFYCFQEHEKNDPQIKKYKLLFNDSENYNNTVISFLAKIITVDKTNQTLYVFIQEEPYTYPSVKVNAGNLDIQNLKKGDLIDIIGIFDGKNQMIATKIWLNEPWKIDLIYLRSLPAIPFVLYLFLRTWKFNTTAWRFERRKKNA